jgi:hypothetical protein
VISVITDGRKSRAGDEDGDGAALEVSWPVCEVK